MELRLQLKPVPDNAAALADLVVPVARQESGADLDYSVASLAEVDRIIEEFREGGAPLDGIGETLFSFGCYVGEVFVRHADGVWRETPSTSMAEFAEWPLVIELGPENLCNPIGKVFKRFQNGEEDDLSYFYRVFAQNEH